MRLTTRRTASKKRASPPVATRAAEARSCPPATRATLRAGAASGATRAASSRSPTSPSSIILRASSSSGQRCARSNGPFFPLRPPPPAPCAAAPRCSPTRPPDRSVSACAPTGRAPERGRVASPRRHRRDRHLRLRLRRRHRLGRRFSPPPAPEPSGAARRPPLAAAKSLQRTCADGSCAGTRSSREPAMPPPRPPSPPPPPPSPSPRPPIFTSARPRALGCCCPLLAAPGGGGGGDRRRRRERSGTGPGGEHTDNRLGAAGVAAEPLRGGTQPAV